MNPLVIGIGGSSGSIYAKTLLDRLAEIDDSVGQVKVLMSTNGKFNWEFELGNRDYDAYGFEIIDAKTTHHPLLRGFPTDMIIVPCSMGLLGRISSGLDTDLISAYMERVLSYRKHGIMIFRDKPLSNIHTNSIQLIQRAGGLVIPATPSFYTGREEVQDLARSVVDRALDHIGLGHPDMYRWGETPDERLPNT